MGRVGRAGPSAAERRAGWRRARLGRRRCIRGAERAARGWPGTAGRQGRLTGRGRGGELNCSSSCAILHSQFQFPKGCCVTIDERYKETLILKSCPESGI